MGNIRFIKTSVINYKDATDKNFYNRINALPFEKRQKGNPGKKGDKPKYKELVSSFDIETTRIHDYTPQQLQEAKEAGEPLADYTVMYIWQWAFTFKPDPLVDVSRETIVIYGRTWEEFEEFVTKLTKSLFFNEYIVVYDHNLAYEFQFLRGVLPFEYDSVFNIQARQPLRAYSHHLEFRCSYKQSNMSLRKFAESMQTPHQKTELDYYKKRFYFTPLTQDELTYAVNDVICLNECIVLRMNAEGDNLTSIPLTSTGYVRREVRHAVAKDKKLLKAIRSIMPDYETYKELKEAFRGGNTHANRFYSNQLIKAEDYGPIHSADRSSSYPAVICNAMYPMSKFTEMVLPDYNKVMKEITKYHKAVLTRIKMFHVKQSDPYWGCPYLSESKCRNIINATLDNGRILSADYLETTVTDVDLQILAEEYTADIEIIDAKTAKYGKIPQPIIDEVIKYYVNKTNLKGVAGQEYFYMKNKNLLNSIYGMMVQDLVKVLTIYLNGDEEGQTGEFVDDPDANPEEILRKAEKHGFLNYAWGVWVTAWARYELERGIKLAGEGFIYCDTDSVKYVGDVDWTDYNNEKIAESLASGSHATDPKGKEHYMGVFEPEHDMEEFKTMGAKKYAYTEHNSPINITVAGVGKKTGARELVEKARISRKLGKTNTAIDEFNEGFIFEGEAGGLEAVYNDLPLGEYVMDYTEDGRPLKVISNVTLRPSTYTLGLTAEYKAILDGTAVLKGDDIL